MSNTMEHRRAELLADVSDHTAVLLCELGVERAHAELCGNALADHLAEHWGGQVISIPVDHAMRLSRREHEIVSDRNAGLSLSELSRKYHITENGLRKLLRRVARRNAVDAQLPLFAANEDQQ